VYVYSISGFEPQSINGAAIATDQTSTCTMGLLFFILFELDLFVWILAKEIRLKHKAPVLSIVVLDGSNQSIGQGSSIPTIESTSTASNVPAPTTMNSENVSPTSSTTVTSHKVLICSEEQFKVFIHFSSYKNKLSNLFFSRFLLYQI
jgi:hypothetical protein